ncbi:hypothetical protein AB833_05430 [Chromatiales bacterium (ex Bugula neritina AB1)]|nr:hypothetical protein AB833_05430 [Chromatiales bacterium (ex Bugula neritina AB1)]
MQKLSNIAFCCASLIAVISVVWLTFPYAARSAQEVELTATPQGAEMFDDIDLGDFGLVPVLDLMQFYVDSPPLESNSSAKKVRFQGC